MLASINVIDLGARSFHTMAATGRYFVRALLVGISMGIRENAGNFDARKGDGMFVDSRYPNLALQELASAIYLVDTRKTPSVNMPSAHRHHEANHVLTQQESTLLCLSTPIRKELVVSAIVAPLESC
jgi:hypothetical protein